MRGRRTIAAAIAAAVVATAGGAAQAGGAPTASGAADCVPVQHSKKVVKRVKVRKKNGRVVKVKRKRTIRWETCEQPPPSPAEPAPASLAPCPEPASGVSVTARDNNGSPRYSLSRLCVNAGTVRVQLENQGEDPHNVFLRPLGLASTEPAYRVPDDPPFYELEAWPGQPQPVPVAEADIVLTQGDWYLWCDLLSHEEQGMSATLQVR